MTRSISIRSVPYSDVAQRNIDVVFVHNIAPATLSHGWVSGASKPNYCIRVYHSVYFRANKSNAGSMDTFTMHFISLSSSILSLLIVASNYTHALDSSEMEAKWRYIGASARDVLIAQRPTRELDVDIC